MLVPAGRRTGPVTSRLRRAVRAAEKAKVAAEKQVERAQRAWIVDQPMNYRVPPELADGSVDLLPAPEMLANGLRISCASPADN